jgi:hypothetical protein
LSSLLDRTRIRYYPAGRAPRAQHQYTMENDRPEIAIKLL